MLDLDRNTLAGCNMELGGEPHNRRMVYCMIESDTATSCCQTDCMVLNHDPLTRPSPLMECPGIFSWKFMYRVGIVVSNLREALTVMFPLWGFPQ